MKRFILILFLLIPISSYAGDKGLDGKENRSLFVDSIYFATSVTIITSAIFIYEIEANNRTQYDQMFDNFKQGLTHVPTIDPNPFYVNYILHPICGSETFLLARNRGVGIFGSFVYSTIGSFAWEYGLESFIGAKPSVQDLIVTSTVGSLLGELRFYLKDKTDNGILLFILDPVDYMFGDDE